MSNTKLLNEIVSYGLQNKKKKDEILRALLKSGQVEVGTAASAMKSLTDLGAFDYGDTTKEDLNEGGPQVTSAVAQELGDSKAAEEMIKSLESSIGGEAGKKAFSPVIGQLRANNPWDTDVQSIQSQINATKQIVGKYLEGGVLRLEDEKKYEKILPKIGDTPEVAQNKIEQVKKLIGQKYKSQTGTLGEAGFDVSGFSREDEPQAPSVDPEAVKRFNATLQHAQANPNDPKAQKFLGMIKKGEIDPVTGIMKSQAQVQPSGDQVQSESFKGALDQKTEEAQEPEEKGDWMGKVGGTLGDIFGGKKIGEALGNVVGGKLAKYGQAGETFKKTVLDIEERYQHGKITEDQRNRLLEGTEKNAKDAFGYDGPSAKELAGDAIKIAATVLGGAELKGATLLGSAARAAAVGATYATGNAMAENKNLEETAKDAVIGAAIGGVIPIAGKVIGKAGKFVLGKNTPEEALGQILQGKTKDLKAGQKALSVIETKGVKTFEELSQKLDDSISELSGHVDKELSKDTSIIKLNQLVSEAKTDSGKIVKTNFVKNALGHLQEMYSQIGDNVGAANIKELVQKATKAGLTRKEVNDISREYGQKFGKKAFGKTGEALTSVNAQMFENTRKGLKLAAREGLGGEPAKNLDALIHDQIHTKDLIDKNVEAVNRLRQKAEKMGVGRKVVRGLIKTIDTITIGATRAIRESFIQSNVGRKTMNSLDVEDMLNGNLRIMKQMNKSQSLGKIEQGIRNLNRNILGKAKNMVPGLK